MKITFNQFMFTVAVIAAILCLLFITCDKDKYEGIIKANFPDSFKKDSIQSVKTDSIVRAYYLIIEKKYKQYSVYEAKIKQLEARLKYLKTITYKLQPVKIDSTNQTVNIPALIYNAEIEAGNVCDSIVLGRDIQISIRDSIIYSQQQQIVAQGKEISTKKQALQDCSGMLQQEQEKSAKSKHLNRQIPKIAIGSGLIGMIAALLLVR